MPFNLSELRLGDRFYVESPQDQLSFYVVNEGSAPGCIMIIDDSSADAGQKVVQVLGSARWLPYTIDKHHPTEILVTGELVEELSLAILFYNDESIPTLERHQINGLKIMRGGEILLDSPKKPPT